MKYKLRNDYTFFTANDTLRNKLDAEGKVLEQVIIDEKVHKVDGQLHKLELFFEKVVKDDNKLSKQGDIDKSSIQPVSTDSKKSKQ